MAEIGPTLREARIRARIDMSEVESRTKIRAKYLRAIENEEWDLLPGPVYAKSFLRTYGDYLGLDSRMLVEEFKRRYEGPSDHEPARPVAPLARERERSRGRPGLPPPPALPPWAPIAVVLVAVVAVLYVVGVVLGGGKSKTPPPAGLHAGSRHARTTPTRTTTLPSTPQNVTLHMTPTGPVYVCLVNAHHRFLIFEKTYAPGNTIPAATGHRLLLTLGNANVRITANGKSVPLTPSAGAIRLSLTPTGVQHISLSQTPTCP